MSLKDKMKTYNFWISLVSAVVLILRIIGDKFNFFVDTSLIMDITTGLCSIFVILGILSVPKSSKTSTDNTTEEESTPNQNIETIISNINSSRELLKTMENQISQISNNSNFTNVSEQHLPNLNDVFIEETNVESENAYENIQETQVTNEAATETKLDTSTCENLTTQTKDVQIEVTACDINTNENLSSPTNSTKVCTAIDLTNAATTTDQTINEQTKTEAYNEQMESVNNAPTTQYVPEKAVEEPTLEDLIYMVEALKENFEAISKAFELYKENN